MEIPHVVMHAYRFLATWGGRVDIGKESSLAVYKRPPGAALSWSKLSPELSFKDALFQTGVTGSPQVRKGGKLMMLTSISYLIIQVSSVPGSPVCIWLTTCFSANALPSMVTWVLFRLDISGWVYR